MFLAIGSSVRWSRSFEADSRKRPILLILVGFFPLYSASPVSRPNPDNRIYTTASTSSRVFPPLSLSLSIVLSLSIPTRTRPRARPGCGGVGRPPPPPPPLALACLSPPSRPPLPLSLSLSFTPDAAAGAPHAPRRSSPSSAAAQACPPRRVLAAAVPNSAPSGAAPPRPPPPSPAPRRRQRHRHGHLRRPRLHAASSRPRTPYRGCARLHAAAVIAGEARCTSPRCYC